MECEKCCVPRTRKARPSRAGITKCGACGGIMVTVRVSDKWYTGNPDALAKHFEKRRSISGINKTGIVMIKLGTKCLGMDLLSEVVVPAMDNEPKDLNMAFMIFLSTIGTLACRCGRRGKGNAVCFDAESGRIKACGPGERFGSVLYECTRGNATREEVEETCRKGARMFAEKILYARTGSKRATRRPDPP